jgi:NADH dehydrogenase
VTVLVTGGAGFIGRQLVPALRARGKPVRVLAREAVTVDDAEVVVGDVTRPETLPPALAGVDAVIHLVAILQGKPEDFDRVIAGGTRNVVEAARAAGVRRFVYQSALGLNEESRETIPYFRGKWAAEQAVTGSGVEYVIVRPSFVFSGDGGAFPMFARLAKRAPLTPIVGSGTQRIQPVWIDDMIEVLARAVDEPDAANRTFDLGGPDALDWNEFWARLKQALGVRRPSVHVPMGLMRLQAPLLELLPKPPVTRNELMMLEGGDNTGDVAPAVEAFGVELTPLDEQLRRAT